uniref:Uncharacterized protein n=1 Tax=Octopus bimaculoides TaxID=37653 RepID=A0A0L8HIP4_OCTBM
MPSYTHTRTHIHTHTHTHARTHAHAHTCARKYSHTHREILLKTNRSHSMLDIYIHSLMPERYINTHIRLYADIYIFVIKHADTKEREANIHTCS